MNTSVTSRDAILSVSRQFITQNGFGSVNMRAIAAACGVSVGSVYNYFPSKGDLICAVVESVWHDIFHLSGQSSQFSSFPDCVKWLFDSIRQGCEEYPAFFTLHSLSFSASENHSTNKTGPFMVRIQRIHRFPVHEPKIRTSRSNGCLTASVRAARSILPFSPCTR